MKVYVSSTLKDLREYRAAVDRALRRMGHDVLGMEQYVAEGAAPLARSMADAASADVYIIIVAWRYGSIVRDVEMNPEGKSVTELEYQAACRSSGAVLAFLLDPEEPWPPNHVDAMSAAGGERVQLFRNEIGAKHLVGFFKSPDDLASQVAASVARQGLTRHMAERALRLESVGQSMVPFASGDQLYDMAVVAIREMIREAGTTRALQIRLGTGNLWWSTRLYLLATLLQTLTGVRQLVFSIEEDNRFAGMASPRAVRDCLARESPEIQRFDEKYRRDSGGKDVEREVDRCITLWTSEMGAMEQSIKVGVRVQLLREWLGEDLITRCLPIDRNIGVTMFQAHQIIDSLIPDVPIERRTPEPGPGTPDAAPRATRSTELMVVDRDAFGLELAREWVRTSLPRVLA